MAKKAKAKQPKNKLRLVLTMVLFIASGFLVYSIASEVLITFELTNDLKESKLRLQTIEDETRDLEERKEKLEDPNYIKSYARGEYSITKEGEQIFRLPSRKDKPTSEEEAVNEAGDQ